MVASTVAAFGVPPAQAVRPADNYAYMGVSATSAANVVVAGYRTAGASQYFGFILRSANGGQTWAPAKLLGKGWRSARTEWKDMRFWAVDMATAKVGWAVGSTGSGTSSVPRKGWVVRTTDGGRTWKWQATLKYDAPRHIQALSTKLVYMVTYGQVINAGWGLSVGASYRSTDGGRSWKTLATVKGRGLCMLSPTFGWIVGDDKNVWKTVDGRTFLPLPYWETMWTANCVAASDQTHVWLGLFQGGIWGSSDGGDTWQDRSVKDVPALWDMQAVGPSFACAVGGEQARGSLVLLYDGNGWSRAQTGNSLKTVLWDVDFVDTANGWAVGCSNGMVLHTTDGGHTWAAQ